MEPILCHHICPNKEVKVAVEDSVASYGSQELSFCHILCLKFYILSSSSHESRKETLTSVLSTGPELHTGLIFNAVICTGPESSQSIYFPFSFLSLFLFQFIASPFPVQTALGGLDWFTWSRVCLFKPKGGEAKLFGKRSSFFSFSLSPPFEVYATLTHTRTHTTVATPLFVATPTLLSNTKPVRTESS